jgi:hypothetical protein
MSLLGLGTSYKNNAMSGFRQLANLEENRERANANIEFGNEEMKSQRKTAQVSGTVTGAAMGAQVGSAYAGVGAVPGAVIGGVLGFLSSSLF